MKRKIEIIILIVLWSLSLWTVIVVETSVYEFKLRNYVAFAALVILTLLKLAGYKKSKTILGLILFAASINTLVFTYFDYYITFRISVARLPFFTVLGFQPVSSVLFLALALTHRKEAKAFLTRIFKPSPGEITDREAALHLSFVKRYESKSNSELENILLHRNDYATEAIRAVEVVLASRKEAEGN